MPKPRILLLSAAPRNRQLYANCLPPLGLLGIVSFLESQGVAVDVLDFNDGRKHTPDFSAYGIIGLSINIANISASLSLADAAKSAHPQVRVVAGGPACSAYPEYFMDTPSIDAVCFGEGEYALLDYIRAGSHQPAAGIAGMRIRLSGGKWLDGGARSPIKDLDALPFAAVNKVDLKGYRFPLHRRRPVSAIVTSRGCPHRCVFCFHSMGYQWRARSSGHVLDEIEWQVQKLGIREIVINDDNFSCDLQRMEDILKGIQRRRIRAHFQFQNGLRVDKLQYSHLKLMRDCGVWLIGIAPETGSPRVLEKLGKGIDQAKIRQVVSWCRQLNIVTFAFFMTGFPFEEREDFALSASFIRSLDPDIIQLSRVCPLPGTPLYEMIKPGSEGHLKDDVAMFTGVASFKHPSIGDGEFRRFIKQVNQYFYLRPAKMLALARVLGPRALLELGMYALRTGNV